VSKKQKLEAFKEHKSLSRQRKIHTMRRLSCSGKNSLKFLYPRRDLDHSQNLKSAVAIHTFHPSEKFYQNSSTASWVSERQTEKKNKKGKNMRHWRSQWAIKVSEVTSRQYTSMWNVECSNGWRDRSWGDCRSWDCLTAMCWPNIHTRKWAMESHQTHGESAWCLWNSLA